MKLSILVFSLLGPMTVCAQTGGGGIAGVIQNSLSTANNYVTGISLGLASVYGVLLWIDQTLLGAKTDRMISFGIGFVMIVLSAGITTLILSSGTGS